ncbi:ubiquinone biosynthesis protein COQ4 homolog, mitochondrial-like [Amphibalanus amphitrite]|uniref:ubiquinone biosynthesis protein COQ4 homolog, mitochondrial-like n=1 Tax=Amphibalanus amphitrite TaxID=1232801 RepID=UPI001C9080A7|nr:ubiquinone biosynthesis protein COQ4 homolog, mitochondrial-like [Amphibalanus amphitrite]
MTLLEVAELNECLKKRLNIADTPMMMAGPAVAAPAQVEEEEDEQQVSQKVQTSFTVKLNSFDAAKKVALIKELKACVEGMNLVQAKKFVESAPAVVKADVPKDEAEKLKELLEKAVVSKAIYRRDRPVINSGTVDLAALSRLPDDTLGREYIRFLEQQKVTPDSRDPVRFVDDADQAYVMQRYRESHDLVHTLLGMPTNLLGEVTVKWVEGLQTGLPMCVGGGLLAPLRLKPKHRQRFRTECLPWALRAGRDARFLLSVYWERRWEQPLAELRQELGVPPPPDLLRTAQKQQPATEAPPEAAAPAH